MIGMRSALPRRSATTARIVKIATNSPLPDGAMGRDGRLRRLAFPISTRRSTGLTPMDPSSWSDKPALELVHFSLDVCLYLAVPLLKESHELVPL